jgi:hypothetical protein
MWKLAWKNRDEKGDNYRVDLALCHCWHSAHMSKQMIELSPSSPKPLKNILVCLVVSLVLQHGVQELQSNSQATRIGPEEASRASSK